MIPGEREIGDALGYQAREKFGAPWNLRGGGQVR